VDGLAATYDCGDEGAQIDVVALYNNEVGVGVVIESQRDNLPDPGSDIEALTAVAQSIVWD
jgi:hypothetical protein